MSWTRNPCWTKVSQPLFFKTTASTWRSSTNKWQQPQTFCLFLEFVYFFIPNCSDPYRRKNTFFLLPRRLIGRQFLPCGHFLPRETQSSHTAFAAHDVCAYTALGRQRKKGGCTGTTLKKNYSFSPLLPSMHVRMCVFIHTAGEHSRSHSRPSFLPSATIQYSAFLAPLLLSPLHPAKPQALR